MPLPPQTPAPTDLDGFAAALGRIPSGLFIVSWRAADADRGMLASWVMQSGFEPPLVSVAVGTSRDLLAVVRAGGVRAGRIGAWRLLTLSIQRSPYGSPRRTSRIPKLLPFRLFPHRSGWRRSAQDGVGVPP